MQHILVSCVVAREVWFYALATIRMHHAAPAHDMGDFQDWWRRILCRARKEDRKELNTLIILVAWMIWKH